MEPRNNREKLARFESQNARDIAAAEMKVISRQEREEKANKV